MRLEFIIVTLFFPLSRRKCGWLERVSINPIEGIKFHSSNLELLLLIFYES